MSLSNFEEALADNDFAIKLSPENYLPYLNKGKTLVKLGNLQRSLSYVKQCGKNQ